MGSKWQGARRLVVSGAVALVATALLSGATQAGAAPSGAQAASPRAHSSAATGTGSGTADGVSDSFWLATRSGAVYAFGVPAYGSPGTPLNRPVVSLLPTADRQGYWMVASDGGIFSYGDAHFYGSTGALHLNRPVVGMAATADQKGYWMVASDGGIFSFGDAHFYGSTGALALNKPIVGMAITPDGAGYWLVASDGGVFSFGDAHFYGSTGSLTLNQPIVGMAATPDGAGYWLVAADGGVFSFGDAHFYGSTATTPGEPVGQIVSTRSGQGYWIVQQNGTATPFGDAVSQSAPVTGQVFVPANPGDQAVMFALAQLGKPYIWGGNGPVGYDCSGLALAAWTHGAGVTFARVADDQYHTAGVAVPITALRTGDLVFWGTSQTDWTTVYHTALYVGGNRIVEATGDHVQLNALGQWGSGDLMPDGRRP
jgi:cell wall-associated NlpC family hydrolase